MAAPARADPAIVGRTLRLDGRLYSIVGVMPERFNFPEYAEVWTPLGLEVGGKRDEHRLEVLACLRGTRRWRRRSPRRR